MIDREIGILKGERDIELLGHGRIGRIIDYQEVWSQQPAYAKIFGMSFSYVSDKEDWFGGSIHNEYLRSLYTGGVIGFLAFILLLLIRSEEHTSELQSRGHIVCRLLLEKKK